MPSFSLRSKDNLDQCDRRLQFVANKAILMVDFSIICGHRNEADQMAAYDAEPKKSNAKWLESPHNYEPALAFDFVPYPLDWEDHARFTYIAGIMVGIGHANSIPLTWGGNFRSIKDLPHLEITDWKKEIEHGTS
jgi:peptidoglycan LD-endopeptidase CwlK